MGELEVTVEAKTKVWSGAMKKHGKRMEWLLYMGVALAAVFVALIVAVR